MAIGGGVGDTPRRSDSLRESGRLWTPSSKLVGESGSPGTAPVCSPFAKYIFVAPRPSYTASDFSALRDTWYTPSGQVTTTIAAYVFFLGDSSSCGGTVIAQNRDNPMQRFLLGSIRHFANADIPRGGFFLLGGNQDAGAAASAISAIMFDGGLDFIVLAPHQLPGQEPELSVVAFRHLVASLRWNWGRKKPILLMLGDSSPGIHLIHESQRDSFTSNELYLIAPPELDYQPPEPTPLLLGNIKRQFDIASPPIPAPPGGAVEAQQAEAAILDSIGDLGLNWWPIVAFVPNSSGGADIGASLSALQSRFYHPLLIPADGSGCPFNTMGNLSATAIARARSLFSATTLPGSAAENVTTSAWFWNFDTVRNNSAVADWAVPRGRLTTEEKNLKYFSDVNVVWESRPAYGAHPLYGQPFAMEFYLDARSPSTKVSWSSASSFGNLPTLFGVKERAAGWVSSVEPFLLSPTAQEYYNQGHDFIDNVMPTIPPWARIVWPWKEAENVAWPENVQEEDSTITGGPGGDHMVSRYGERVASEEGPADYRRWSAGANARTVVLSGTPDAVAAEEFDGSAALHAKLAPFALKIQVRNVLMGPDNGEGDPVGLVYPSSMFYVIPVALPFDLEAMGAQALNIVPVGFWSTKDFEMSSTPLHYDTASRQLIADPLITRPGIIIDRFTDDKGDFPPMMDAWDREKRRPLANHFARIDITHSRVVRVSARGPGGGGGLGIPSECLGIEDAGLIWPINDDKQIRITQGYLTEVDNYGGGRTPHCALDINYTDESDEGEPVRAVQDGEVRVADESCAQCGNQVHIRHTLGAAPSVKTFVSRYLHLQDGSITVAPGDRVQKGDTIGRVGNTGTESRGAHLHFTLTCGPNFNPDCKTAGIDPCLVLPPPASGIVHYESALGLYIPGCETEDLALMICTMFSADEILCNDGINRRIRDVALAVARAESGLDKDAQGENTNDAGLITSIDRGVFQINNPCHINNDLIANNIRQSSVHTLSGPEYLGTGCGPSPVSTPGLILVSDDYFDPIRNIQAALRISSNGRNWGPWAGYTSKKYLTMLTPAC